MFLCPHLFGSSRINPLLLVDKRTWMVDNDMEETILAPTMKTEDGREVLGTCLA